MPLDFQLVQTPFRFGVEEGIDPKQVPFGTLTRAENVVWKKSGRLELRDGVTSLGAVVGAKRLIVRGSELAATDGENLYSYAGGSWVDRGRHPELGLEWDVTQDAALGIKSADLAVLSDGLVVYAWVSGDPLDATKGGDVYYQVTHRDSGAMVTPPTLIAGPIGGTGTGATRIRIVASGSSYAIIWSRTGSANGIYSYVNGTTTQLRSDSANSDPSRLLEASFDACTIGGEFVIAYALDAGGIGLGRYTFASTPVQQATGSVTGESSVGVLAISIDGASGENLYITYAEDQGHKVKYATANPSTLAQVDAPTDLDTFTSMQRPSIGVCRVSSTLAVVAWSLYDATDEPVGFLKSTQIGSGASGTSDYSACVRLLSRPFTVGSRQYALVGNFTNTSDLALNTANAIEGSDAYIIDVTAGVSGKNHRLVGKVDLLTGGAWFVGHVSNVPEADIGEHLLVSPMLSEAASNTTGWRQGFRTVRVTDGESVPSDLWRAVSVGAEAYLAAGVLTAYDGSIGVPYGFAHPAYLDWGNTTESDSDGSMESGTYLYNTVPERRSAVGVLHRGPTAVAQSIAVTGPAGLVNLSIVPVHLSTAQDDVSGVLTTKQSEIIVIYRSTADGETLQRLTVEPSYVVLENEYGFAPFTLTDTTNDSQVGGSLDLSTRPALYTEGGELDDFQPPALLTLCTYRNRIFGIDGSRRTVRFSKSHAANPGVAPGFNPAFRIVVDDELTALAVLDERLIIFSRTGIYYMAGDGPAPNGDGPFDAPNKLQTDVGCTNARGVVSGPDGVYFVSGNEIHMLDRGLTVQWVGKRVQDQLDEYPNITSAVLVASKNHVRFSCNNETGDEGIVLVYDYVEKQWSTFKYSFGDENGRGAAIADACLWSGAYTFVTVDGEVYQEDSTTRFDAGEEVPWLLETAWVHAAGPLAYHAVANFRIDGVCAEQYGLSICVGFDGNETYQQGPRTWAPGVAGVTAPGPVTANVSIGTRRKCRSIRFKIEGSSVVSEGASGEGVKWSSMGIEVGVMGGFGRLAERQKG